MSRKYRYITHLGASEKQSLRKGYRNGTHHLFRRKCHCILLSNEGKTVGELSTFFGVSTISIYSWLNQWEAEGITGLHLKPGRGRPKKLNADEADVVKTIKTLIENNPRNLGQVVEQVKEKLGVDLSKKTLKRFLKNLTTGGNASEKT